MADTKITALAAITTVDPAADVLPIVDISDTSMAASGTTKKITSNQILGAGGTATLASATITGDLTVDTSTLKVDSANNRVGVLTATPGDTLDVNGRVTALRYLSSSSNAALPSFAVSAGNGAYNSGTNEIGFSINSTSAMTLNATGLGVGTSPAYKFQVRTTSDGVCQFMQRGGGTNNPYFRVSFIDATATTTIDASSGAGNPILTLATGGSDRLIIDSSGNVGIGVTPSAQLASYKSFQFGIGGNLIGRTDNAGIELSSNAYRSGSGSYIYLNTDNSASYRQYSGAHQWFNAPSGTAGNAITFTQAMTLDASGNLAIGSAATGTRRLEVKSAGTSNTTFAAHFRDSADTLLFHVRSDGYFNTGQGTLSPYSNTTASAANMFVDSSGFVYRSTSSLKYKTDVKDSIHGLADVLKLRSVTYKSKNGDDTVFGGLIAEEVHAAGLTEFVAYAPDKTPDSINYGNMVALLVSAIKELTARVEALEA
jgi:hypothetical protein